MKSLELVQSGFHQLLMSVRAPADPVPALHQKLVPLPVEVLLDDELLDRIDAIVPPGTDVAPLEGAACLPPSIEQISLRRRPIAERAAA